MEHAIALLRDEGLVVTVIGRRRRRPGVEMPVGRAERLPGDMKRPEAVAAHRGTLAGTEAGELRVSVLANRTAISGTTMVTRALTIAPDSNRLQTRATPVTSCRRWAYAMSRG